MSRFASSLTVCDINPFGSALKKIRNRGNAGTGLGD
jgi:hypothetical protein